MMDQRKRKRPLDDAHVASKNALQQPAGQTMSQQAGTYASSSASLSSLPAPYSPSPSYHLPRFLEVSPTYDEDDDLRTRSVHALMAHGPRYLQHDDSTPAGSDASMDASYSFVTSEDESNASFSQDGSTCSTSSLHLSLSCAEGAISTSSYTSGSSLYDDRYDEGHHHDDLSEAGDETPSEALRTTGRLSQSSSSIHGSWGEESADSFADRATPSGSSLMASSLYTPAMSASSSSSSSSTSFEDFGFNSGTGTWSTLSDDIYQEVRTKEENTPRPEILPEYHKTRPILVDWMLDVGDYFAFHGATTHLAIALLDRLLVVMSIERNKLQLVATTCLLIAAKLEEIPSKVPTLTEFNERTLDTYTPDLIRTCERVVLLNLDWNLTITSPRSVLDFFLSEVNCVSYDDRIQGSPLSYGRSREEEWVTTTAHHIMTSMVMDHHFLRFRPSILAAVCLAVARRQARIEPLWPERLEHKTGYSLSDLSECFNFTWTHRSVRQSGQEAMET